MIAIPILLAAVVSWGSLSMPISLRESLAAALKAGLEEGAAVIPLERALLGAALCDPSGVLPSLTPEDFFLERNGACWRAILGFREEGRPVDATLVADRMRAGGDSDAHAWIAGLIGENWAAVNAEEYANRVREAARARSLRRLGLELLEGEGLSEIQVLERLTRLPPAIARDYDPAAAWGRIVDSWGRRRLKTGLGGLDRIIGGIYPGDFIVIGGRTSHGKALALDTPIPTPSGWTTMGEIAVGDTVIGSDGRPVVVTYVSPVVDDRPCYRVEFSDGAIIVADGEHQWFTWTRAARRSAYTARMPRLRNSPYSWDQRDKRIRPSVVTTVDIARSLHHGSYANHAIQLCGPLRSPAASLPIHPYILGVWLGDGTTANGNLTTCDTAILERLEALGQRARPRRDPITFCLLGLQAKLRALGVLGVKHIPMAYLRASESQRRFLLAGLLDTDGTVNHDGSVGLTFTRRALAQGALELIRSLGFRATMSIKPVRGRIPETCRAFSIRFVTRRAVFLLPRKATTLTQRRRGIDPMGQRVKFRIIVKVTPVPSVPVRCIQVDAEDGLYLVSRSWIPTHNTSLAVDLSLRFASAAAAGGLPLTVEYVTSEESADAIVRRQVSNLSSIPFRRLKHGELGAEEFGEAERAVVRLQDLPLTVTGLETLRGVGEDRVLAHVRASTASVLIFDHIQKVATRGESRVYGLERVMNAFHASTAADRRALILCAQLSRDMDFQKREPVISDLRDCGGIEQAARQVWLLYYPWKHRPERDPHDYLLNVAKHADGETGRVLLRFEPATGNFSDPEAGSAA